MFPLRAGRAKIIYKKLRHMTGFFIGKYTFLVGLDKETNAQRHQSRNLSFSPAVGTMHSFFLPNHL